MEEKNKCENCECEAGCEKDACPQCTEYMEGWKRALADYENLKKEMDATLTKGRERIRARFAESLLPVMDNFDQAVRHVPETEDAKVKTWLQGVTFIKQQFEAVLKDLGLEPVATDGAFDPNLHEAVEEKEGEGGMEVVSQGWKIGETVIRPAKVIVKK